MKRRDFLQAALGCVFIPFLSLEKLFAKNEESTISNPDDRYRKCSKCSSKNCIVCIEEMVLTNEIFTTTYSKICPECGYKTTEHENGCCKDLRTIV